MIKRTLVKEPFARIGNYHRYLLDKKGWEWAGCRVGVENTGSLRQKTQSQLGSCPVHPTVSCPQPCSSYSSSCWVSPSNIVSLSCKNPLCFGEKGIEDRDGSSCLKRCVSTDLPASLHTEEYESHIVWTYKLRFPSHSCSQSSTGYRSIHITPAWASALWNTQSGVSDPSFSSWGVLSVENLLEWVCGWLRRLLGDRNCHEVHGNILHSSPAWGTQSIGPSRH